MEEKLFCWRGAMWLWSESAWAVEKTRLLKSRAAQPAEKDAVSDSWKLKTKNFKIEIRDVFLKREIQTWGAAALGTCLSFTPHARGVLSILTPEAPNQPIPVLLRCFPPSLLLLRLLLSP